ncbi:flavin reductase [Chondromyces apiculatus]|uniref:NADH-FMN oxidoreductase n=1 Tax=Chondromyces apiculatus DSM 436 TaxID=1192034 RepID=A0A017SVY1_9BACT|nr:flavin reductase [Chondromyces apiculatus]EYF00927.1 NADH-FMN oxidoreductase [Chondromyces apiculatus DSM 436]
MTIAPSEFRRVLGQFASGVTVVSATHDGVTQAMTVSAFCSVSIEPPMVLFCADKRSRTHVLAAASGAFAVSFLREDQRALSDLFAGKGSDDDRKAALTGAPCSALGCPIIEGALAWLGCRIVQTHDAGDHVIYVGHVLDGAAGTPFAPLLYYRGTYQALEPAWRWRDRHGARDRAVAFHEMVDFFERMQHEDPYAGLLDHLARIAAPTPEARCLDLGCGPGTLTRKLAAGSREALGVDSSAAMVTRASLRARAAGLANVRYEEASLVALPCEAGSFDVVVAANALFHAPVPRELLREAARVLRPGGRLGLLEPSSRMTHEAVSLHLARDEEAGDALAPLGTQALLAWADAVEARPRYDEAQLHDDLEAVGLALVAEEPLLGGLATLTLARR